MSEKKWVKVSEGLDVAFSLPCQGCYHYERVLRINTGCDKPDDKHGHIELCEEEGMLAFISFPCYSQAGVKAATEFLKPVVSEEECRAILDLEEIKKLPEEMTEEEKLFIASLPEDEEKKKQVVFGHWRGW